MPITVPNWPTVFTVPILIPPETTLNLDDYSVADTPATSPSCDLDLPPTFFEIKLLTYVWHNHNTDKHPTLSIDQNKGDSQLGLSPSFAPTNSAPCIDRWDWSCSWNALVILKPQKPQELTINFLSHWHWRRWKIVGFKQSNQWHHHLVQICKGKPIGKTNREWKNRKHITQEALHNTFERITAHQYMKELLAKFLAFLEAAQHNP